MSIDSLSPQGMQRFIKAHQIGFPIALDSHHQVAQQYRVRGTPTTYLINREGKVIGGTVGPKDWGNDTAQNMIRQLLSDTSAE